MNPIQPDASCRPACPAQPVPAPRARRAAHSLREQARVLVGLALTLILCPGLIACAGSGDTARLSDQGLSDRGSGDLGSFGAESEGVFGDLPTAASDDRGARRDPDGGARAGSGGRERRAVSMETPPTWTIMVASVGEGRDPEQTRRNVQDALGMTVRLEDRAGKPVIAYGEYRGPDDPRAIRDLARIKETNVGGVPVFSRAVMMPPDEVVRGSRPEWDLKNVRERRGPDALYTLQIGVYGREDYRTPEPAELVEFRRLAEEAVSRLRAEGEEAFYNHGPSMSSVTVGVFGPKDHDPRVLPPRESPALKAARDRHPYNLLNGQAIKERRAGRSGGTVETLQSSVLVAIPE